MKTITLITMAAAACAGMAGSVASASEEVIVQHARVSPEVKATNACMNAFVDKILPGTQVKVRTVIADNRQLFLGVGSVVDAISVEMSARASSNGALLATGNCVVNRGATVQSLTARVKDQEKLASLTIKDIRLAVR